MKLTIKGGDKLKGEVKVSGNKNSILTCLAATLLSEEEIILKNVPNISDVTIFLKIMEHLGAKVAREEDFVKISSKNIKKTEIPIDLMRKLRASITLVGSLLARLGEVKFSHPGGDVIGQRSIGVHLDGFRALGAQIVSQNDLISIKLSKEKTSVVNIFLEEASQTGTSNLIMGSVLGNRIVRLRNCAKEPSNIDLCRLLIQMGAHIEGVGTDTLTIMGVSKLSKTNFRISDDFTEISTYAIATAVTGGKVKIICNESTDLEPVLTVLRKFGIIFTKTTKGYEVTADTLMAVDSVKTNIWPGFPTDLMSVLIVLASQANGTTLCHDWMYESRMFFVDKLISMGAKITIADPHRVLVSGPTKLMARELETPDIRAGMALVLAALIADGESTIHKAELIERGYEDVVQKLRSLGANVKRME